MESNPFKPGAGRIPPELAGRAAILDRFTAVLRETRDADEAARPWILYGLRGVGKTVLLTQFNRDARELGYVTVKVEASLGQSLPKALIKQLHLALRQVMSGGDRAKSIWAAAARAFRSFQVTVDPNGNYGFGFTVEAEEGVADSGDLAVDLAELLTTIGRAARDAGTGVFIAVDELQEAPPAELAAVNTALHALGQDVFPVPVVFVGAGLPTLRAVLADANTYAERLYDYRNIGLLTETETIDALTTPMPGVTWDRDALDATLLSTGGYPYAAQTYGFHVWESRAQEGRVTVADADLGAEAARAEMDAGVYGSRWARVNDRQKAYLAAMAEDAGAPSTVSRVAERLGKKVTDLSKVRDELIRQGFIYAPARGVVAFTLPGMDGFIRRQQ